MTTLTTAEANAIADALLAGCMHATTAEYAAPQGSLARASAAGMHAQLRDAMLLLEGRIALAAPEEPTPLAAPTHPLENPTYDE